MGAAWIPVHARVLCFEHEFEDDGEYEYEKDRGLGAECADARADTQPSTIDPQPS